MRFSKCGFAHRPSAVVFPVPRTSPKSRAGTASIESKTRPRVLRAIQRLQAGTVRPTAITTVAVQTMPLNHDRARTIRGLSVSTPDHSDRRLWRSGKRFEGVAQVAVQLPDPCRSGGFRGDINVPEIHGAKHNADVVETRPRGQHEQILGGLVSDGQTSRRRHAPV